MNTKNTLSLGWVAAISFVVGSVILGSLLENYNPIAQTVSEIGKIGTPFHLPWQVFTIAVGSLLLVFSLGLVSYARKQKLSIVPPLFMLSYGISQFFIGVYPSPHPLHNVFGLSMTIGYFSPLVFALTWKSKLGRSFKKLSLISFVLVIIGIFLNLSPAFAPTLYPLDYYGIVQRFLLFSFYFYCAIVSYTIINAPMEEAAETTKNNSLIKLEA